MEEKSNINYTDGTGKPKDGQVTPAPQSTENLSEADKNAIERDKVRAEKKAYKEKRKIKRAKKTLRCRRGKNFGWFLIGFFASIILLLSGILVGVKLIPLKTYFGEKTSEYVDEEKVGGKSLVDAILSISDYTLEDIPVVNTAIYDLLSSAGIENIIRFDKEKLKDVKFDSSFGQGLLNSAKVSEDLFGDLSELEMFQNVSVMEPDVSASDFMEKVKLYYYQVENDGDITWERAYDDDGTRVEGSEGKQLYLRALQEFSIDEMQELFSVRFEMLSVASVLKTLADIGNESLISKIVGDRTVKEMSDFDSDDILLSTVLSLPGETPSNATLYDVIRDAVAYDPETGTYDESVTNETLTLGDLSGLNIDGVKLCRVVGNTSENATLYDVIRDAVAYDSETGTYDESVTNDSICFGDLKKINILGVRLNTVIKAVDIGDNAVLRILLEDETVCFGNLADKIDKIKVSDLYEVECFVTDYAQTNDVYARYSYSYDSVNDRDVYTLDPTGDYYVNKNSGVWMLILYNAGAADANGYATTYTDKDLRFKNLRGNVGNLSDIFMGATIRQLFVAGVINTEYDNIMTLTVHDVLAALNAVS